MGVGEPSRVHILLIVVNKQPAGDEVKDVWMG